MSKRIDHLLRSIAETIGEAESDRYARIIGCQARDMQEGGLSVTQEGKAMKAILDDLVSTHGEDAARRALRPCGHQCIAGSVIREAVDIHNRIQDLPAFIAALNEHHIGGGQMRLEDNKIIGVYDHCYCGTAKNTKNMPPIYCECSAGWMERLFFSVFGKPVRVEIRTTILRGDSACAFEVSDF